MDFYSYEKMPESLSKLNLETAATKKLDKATWVVTEKIHGANFSFVLDNKGIGYAKRKELLAWEDDFFGFQLVAQQLQTSLYKLFDMLRADYDFEKAQLYGELFGGAYPHPDVPAIAGLQAIQTGIYYAPDIQFCAFDLALTNSDGIRNYLPYTSVMAYCKVVGIFYAAPFFIGSLQQVLNYEIHISSKVPSQLGLPPLSDINLIEGVVIKPIGDLIVETPKGSIRPILKIKNPEFSEEVYGEAQKWSYFMDTDEDALLFYADDLRKLVNHNRLQSAISKIGHPDSPERREQLRQLLWEDILEAYAEKSAPIDAKLLETLKIMVWPLLRDFIELTIQKQLL